MTSYKEHLLYKSVQEAQYEKLKEWVKAIVHQLSGNITFQTANLNVNTEQLNSLLKLYDESTLENFVALQAELNKGTFGYMNAQVNQNSTSPILGRY